MIARETIYEAVFALVLPLLAPGVTAGPPDGKPDSSGNEAAPGAPSPAHPFNLISREVIEVQRVPPLLQPVLFMDEAMEDYVDDGGGLYHRRWTVYFHVGCVTARGTAAATVLNPLIDALEAALVPTDSNLLALGDIVSNAQVSGLSVKNLGNNSVSPDTRQAVAYVPFQLNFGPY
jgi:uncharacterized protein YejL (UPF0352 family)